MTHEDKGNNHLNGINEETSWPFFPSYETVLMGQRHGCFQDGIDIKLLQEETTRLDFALEKSSFNKGSRVLDQRFLLQRRETRQNVLFVTSLLALDALPPFMQKRASERVFDQPLEWLFGDAHLHRAMLVYERQPAGQFLVAYMAIDPRALCSSRTMLYCLDIPILLLYEIIPA